MQLTQGKRDKMQMSFIGGLVLLAATLLWLLLARESWKLQTTSSELMPASWSLKSLASMNASLVQLATLSEDLQRLYAQGGRDAGRASEETDQRFTLQDQTMKDAEKPLANCPKETASTAEETVQKAKEIQSAYCRAFLAADLTPNPERYVQTALTAFGMVTPIVIYAVPDFVSQQIRKHGAWDRPKVNSVLEKMKLVQDFWTAKNSSMTAFFLDIGANIGAFTLAVASHGYHVLAFEPMPGNEAALRQSICLSSNFTASGLDTGFMERITYYNVGLSTEESVCIMISGEGNNSDGIMVCGDPVSDPNYRPRLHYRTQGRVRIIRIDDAITVTDRNHIAVAKIDVEGFEQIVVRGGPQVFGGSIPFITCEFNAASYRPTPASFLQTWHDAGYVVHYGGNGWESPVVSPSEFETVQIKSGTDIFLVSKEFADKK